jgi:hypothetical protein
MTRRELALNLALISAVAGLTIFAGEKSQSQVTAILPLAGQSISVPTTAGGTQVVAPNPTRRGLLICNVGTANPMWIAPQPPAGVAGVTVAANAAGAFQLSVMPGAGNGVVPSCLSIGPSIPASASTLQPLVTSGFNGITTGGASNATVWEF